MDKQNEPTHEVKIDTKSIIQQIADRAIIDLLIALTPDESSRKLLAGLMSIHRKYGIDSVTSIKIMADMGELLKYTDNTND